MHSMVHPCEMTVCLPDCLWPSIGRVDETMTHPCSKSQVHAISSIKGLPISFNTLKITLANHSLLWSFFFTSMGIFFIKKQNPLQPTEIHLEPKLTNHSVLLAARLDNEYAWKCSPGCFSFAWMLFPKKKKQSQQTMTTGQRRTKNKINTP